MKMANMGLHLICFYLLAVILLQRGSQTVVEAVDIQTFNDPNACSGAGFNFAGIPRQTCALFSPDKAGSVLIRDLKSCQTGRVFNGGGCAGQVSSGTGPNVLCFVGGGFTGADWDGC